jgi:glycosyltransferase involved in cell wall biosynthesis
VKVSLVIPAYNEEKLLGGTLKELAGALAAFTGRGWETEVIVCDNNSSDRTAEVARGHGAEVVFEPVNMIARARNTGAKAASGEWLIFLDADTHPTRELLGDVALSIESGRVLAGGSTVQMVEPIPSWGRSLVHVWNGISRLMRWVAGSFIFCETRAFRALGGFNQELYASEEIELSRRLKRMARKEGRSVRILTQHPIRTSERKLHLYTPREHLLFIVRTVLLLGRPLKSAKACHTWYDGRR